MRNWKKLIITVFACLTMVVGVCGFSACRKEKACEHQWGDWVVTQSPTCESGGLQTRTCSLCKETETDPISAKGHKYNDGVITKPATCEENGQLKRTCTVCSSTTMQDVSATGHNSYIYTYPAQCEIDGYVVKKCSTCNIELGTRTILPATGHAWRYSYESSEDYCTNKVTIDGREICCEAVSSKNLEFDIGATEATLIGIGNCKDEKVYIPSKVFDSTSSQHLPVTTISSDFKGETIGYSQITYAEVIGNVTTIEGNTSAITEGGAFADCKNLKTLILADSVTEIGAEAFRNCPQLEKIRFSLSLTNIGEGAFGNCSSLKKVELLATEGSELIVEADAFQNCTSLETVVFGDETEQDVDGVIQTVYLTNVKEIKDGAFENCSSLKTLILYQGVESIGEGAFANCSSLNNLTLSEKLKTIGNGAFVCTGLTNLVLPESLESVGEYAFSDSDKLTNVTFKGETSIGEFAFAECNVLKNLTLVKYLTTVADGAFDGCIKLENVYIKNTDNWLNIEFATARANPLSSGTTTLWVEKEVNSKITNEKVVSLTANQDVKAYAFYNYQLLSSVHLKNGVTEIGDNAFANCKNLKTLYYNGSCISFTAESGVFLNAGANMAVTIGKDVVNIPAYMFAAPYNEIEKAPKISSVQFETLDATKEEKYACTSIEKFAFYGCSTMTSLVIPATVEEIGDSAFDECTKIKTISMPIMAIEHISQENFETVTLYGNSKGTVVEAGAFKANLKLASLTIGEGVTEIGANAFAKCTALRKLVIGKDVTNIGVGAFAYCEFTEATFEDCLNWKADGKELLSSDVADKPDVAVYLKDTYCTVEWVKG